MLKATAVAAAGASKRGGDRRALQLQPLRVVVIRNGRTDVLECGHELDNPFRNVAKQRHCTKCPTLAEPASHLSRLRLELDNARLAQQIDGRALAQQYALINLFRDALRRIAKCSASASVEFARRIANEALAQEGPGDGVPD